MSWTINLPRELDGFVEQMIVSGRYGSTAELMVDALSLLKERAEDMAAEEALLLEGMKPDPGEDIPAEEVFAELRAKVHSAEKRQAAE